MLDFINLLLEGLGLPSVVSISEISSLLGSYVEWWQMLNPQLLFSIVFYLACSWGLFSLTLRYMYRIVKKVVHYPHKKGCEYK